MAWWFVVICIVVLCACGAIIMMIPFAIAYGGVIGLLSSRAKVRDADCAEQK